MSELAPVVVEYERLQAAYAALEAPAATPQIGRRPAPAAGRTAASVARERGRFAALASARAPGSE